MTRVLIIAHTPMAQAGLRAMLSTAGIEVVGETSRLESFVTHEPEIDVIVLADETLLANVGRTVADTGNFALVVLSDNDEGLISSLRGLHLRSWGIVPADAPAAQVQAAVFAVSQGLVAVPAALSVQLQARQAAVGMAGVISTQEQDEALTAREREVLELLSQGLSNKLIARRLQISEHTVKFHVSSISNKLGAASRTDAVSRGIRRGLITL
jgi:DNA-binding NarL/FixJ family response regulator